MNASPLGRWASAGTFAAEASFDSPAVEAQWKALERRGTPFQTRAGSAVAAERRAAISRRACPRRRARPKHAQEFSIWPL
jgi:hypothetical protein